MNCGSDSLEHLISRELDGECTPDERKRLAALRRHDPQARHLYDEYRELDHEFGEALRDAFGRRRRVVRMWQRVGRGLMVAAAASFAAIAWLYPQPTQSPSSNGEPVQAGMTPMRSWFAPDVPRADVVEPVPSTYERPELRLRGTERDWILIPGERAGAFFVIEVDHVRTHVIGVHEDF